MKTPEDNIGGSSLLSVSAIVPDPKNRKKHDGDALKSLAESIKTDGLLQPIVVRQVAPGKYMLVAGERRWRAHGLLNRAMISAIVTSTGVQAPTAADVRKRAAENFQREDLTPIEEAQLFRELHIEHKIPQAEIAKIRGRGNQSTVANSLRLLELPAEVQEMIQAGKLSRAHGIALVSLAAWKKVCVFVADYCTKKEVLTKSLEKRIPCGDELDRAGLAVNLYEDLDVYNRSDLPKELKGQASVVVAINRWNNEHLICLDVPLAKKLVAAKEAKEAAEEKAASRESGSGGRSGGNGKLSAAEAAKRKKVIAENKQARLESSLAHKAVIARLKSTKEIDPAMLVLVAQRAFGEHWKNRHAPRVKRIAEELGIKVSANLDSSNYSNEVSLTKLGALKPLDLVRLCCGCICDRSSEDAVSFAHEIEDEVALVLGAKVTKVCKDQAAAELAAKAKAKAAKKGGAK